MPDNYNARLLARGYGARRSGAATPTTSRSSTPSPETNCAPPCADCGQLACLCRPRFFAGQLLSEQDLNRLDAYIRAKNKLHTLQLNGWGVVNGLDVRCEPCDTGVVVGRGYAISPCGDDIIVCCDAPVDVCALIQKCLPPDNTCQPYRGAVAGGCEDMIEDWVLAIRYTETPARGVTALRFGASCSCGASGGSCSCGAKRTSSSYGCKTISGSGAKPCGCGAGSSGSCGCGVAAATTAMPTTSTTAKPRGASPECEPTVICEGYAWDVFRAPLPPSTKRTALDGPLIERMRCCLQPLLDVVSQLPGKPGTDEFGINREKWQLWCCQTKGALIAYLSSGPESNCTLVEELLKFSCPDPTRDTFVSDMQLAFEVLLRILLDAVLACLCAALLPPAPYGTIDDRVPLAVVRVRKKDCRVVEVCNWTPLRKTVLSFPALEYWLSWIPLFGSLGDIIHRLCCTRTEMRGPPDPGGGMMNPMAASRPPGATAAATDSWTAFSHPRESAVLRANPTLSPEAAGDNQTFTTLITDALRRGTTPLDPVAIVGGLFGFDAGAKQTLSSTELANAPHFLLLNEVLRPIATSLANQHAADIQRGAVASAAAGGESTAPGAASTSGTGAETEALKARISALEQAIKHLQATQGKHR